jgi:hypothetical protein
MVFDDHAIEMFIVRLDYKKKIGHWKSLVIVGFQVSGGL